MSEQSDDDFFVAYVCAAGILYVTLLAVAFRVKIIDPAGCT